MPYVKTYSATPNDAEMIRISTQAGSVLARPGEGARRLFRNSSRRVGSVMEDGAWSLGSPRAATTAMIAPTRLT